MIIVPIRGLRFVSMTSGFTCTAQVLVRIARKSDYDFWKLPVTTNKLPSRHWIQPWNTCCTCYSLIFSRVWLLLNLPAAEALPIESPSSQLQLRPASPPSSLFRNLILWPTAVVLWALPVLYMTRDRKMEKQLVDNANYAQQCLHDTVGKFKYLAPMLIRKLTR